MSNVNAPFGVVQSNARTRQAVPDVYSIASGYSTDLFTGQLVKQTGTGGNIEAASAGDRFEGIFVGCTYTETDGSFVQAAYWPASTVVQTGSKVQAFVLTDPDMEVIVQCNGTASEDIIGANANVVVGTGDKVSGLAKSTLNVGSGQVDTTARQLRIVGLDEEPNNSWDDAYPVVRCRFNNSAAQSSTGV